MKKSLNDPGACRDKRDSFKAKRKFKKKEARRDLNPDLAALYTRAHQTPIVHCCIQNIPVVTMVYPGKAAVLPVTPRAPRLWHKSRLLYLGTPLLHSSVPYWMVEPFAIMQARGRTMR